MKKKVRFWMYVSAGLILAIVGIWVFWPEYGSGYSEDQRRNWNESDEEGKNMFLFGRGVDTERRTPNKRKAQTDAIQWKVNLMDQSEQLPLEGMSVPALKQLVEQGNGNGDVCLELAFRSLSGFPTASDTDRAEKYLKKAVKLGRPGADFLLRLLDSWRKHGEANQGQDIEGYRDFLLRLDGGYFSLGKVFVLLSPHDEDGLSRLDLGLRKRVEAGDVASLRNRGHLMFLKISREPFSPNWWVNRILSNYLEHYLKRDLIIREIKNVTEFFPEWIRPDVMMFRGMVEDFCKWERSRDEEAIRRSFDEPLAMLAEAAKRGDLHAKYLWNQAVIWCLNFFPKEDWENHLRYADDLVKAGGIYRGNDPFLFEKSDFPLESFYYEERSFKKMEEVLSQLRKKECEELFPSLTDKPELLRMEVSCSNDIKSFIFSYINDVFGEKKMVDEERMYGLRLIEQAAEEGDVLAMLALGRLLNAGCVVKQDVRKSWALFQNVKEWCDTNQEQGESRWSDSVTVFLEKGKTDLLSIDRVLGYEMLGIVSRYGDMPGMTVDQAFDQFMEEINDNGRGSSSEKMPDHIQLQLKEQFEKLGYQVPDKK